MSFVSRLLCSVPAPAVTLGIATLVIIVGLCLIWRRGDDFGAGIGRKSGSDFKFYFVGALDVLVLVSGVAAVVAAGSLYSGIQWLGCRQLRSSA